MRSLLFKMKRYFLFKYQKITRGFDDSEIWNLNDNFVNFILPRLKEYRKQTKGVITPTENTIDFCEFLLDDMITGFENYKDWSRENKGNHNINKIEKEIENSLRIFADYFGLLWY